MNYPKLHPIKTSMLSNNPDTRAITHLKLINFLSGSNTEGSSLVLSEHDKSVNSKNPILESKITNIKQNITPVNDSKTINEQNSQNSTSQQIILHNQGIKDDQKSIPISKRVIEFINLVPETVAQVRKIDESFNQDAENEKPLFYLKNLETTLFKIFKGDNLTIEDFQLTIPELHILVEILIRKHKGSPNCR